ncbi:hypothetical protein [Limnoglobus roseus]|uniref:Uncharacterized protein n=1 Tax=Limnoglobus roseus TaxID=2598579 RepID=A0A5C1A8X1_9BACT|nr:hypothetical protein [Limnoglobus roseus]QEL15631.1 hypothetical protein PX52LOC_02564 [Limnoglobus roseus]
MRRSVTASLLTSALWLTGCGESHPHAKEPVNPPVVAPQPPKDEPKAVTPEQKGKAVVPEPYHRAEDGPFTFGDATITVEGVLWSKYDKTIDTILVSVKIEYSKDAKPARIQGFAGNNDAIRKLTGKGVVNAPTNQTDLTAKSDAGDSCRVLIRTLRDRGWDADSSISAAKVAEVKVIPGATYRWVLQFERPFPKAKRLQFEIPAEDIGGVGKIRLDVPSQDRWKLEN